MGRHSIYILLALIVASCGSPSGRFRLEGRFKNLNQGEFYIYSMDRGTKDTITVKDGRFVYDVPMTDSLTLTLMFPNYSEMPIFAASGAEVTINGDASHLKETEVRGTKENEKMTAFRLRANQLTPPEARQAAAQFISDEPLSPISLYLLQHYFIITQDPDYTQAYQLCKTMLQADSTNVRIHQLRKQLALLKSHITKGKLPAFSATDTQGRKVTETSLNTEANIIMVWASWDYPSQNMLRQLNTFLGYHKDQTTIVSICIDASPHEGKRYIERDNITWSNICDGKMWQSPLLARLGIASLPANILVDKKGNIIARNLPWNELREKAEKLLE